MIKLACALGLLWEAMQDEKAKKYIYYKLQPQGAGFYLVIQQLIEDLKIRIDNKDV